MAGFENDVLLCENVNFLTNSPKPHTGRVTADGQLLIGSSVYPFLDAATLNSSNGSITITNGHNSILLDAGASVPTSFITNAGTAIPSSNVLHVVGGTGISTSGSGSTLTITATSSFIGTLNGDTGTASGASVNVYAATGFDNGSTVKIVGNNASTLTLQMHDGNDNVIIGRASGNGSMTGNLNYGVGTGFLQNNTSGGSNHGMGYLCMNGNTTGGENIAFGHSALQANSGGSFNVAIGDFTLLNVSADANVGIGYQALRFITTGTRNLAIGVSAGTNYATGNESHNCLLNHGGVNGESNTMRLGATGSGSQQQNRAFIAATYSTSVPGDFVTINSSEQLGSVSPSTLLTSQVNIFDDFIGSSTSATGSTALGQQIWFQSATWNQRGTTLVESGHPGVLTNPSTGAGAESGLYLSDNQVSLPIIVGGGAIKIGWVFKIATLSDVTNTYTLRCGLGDTQGLTGDEVNGLYFEYSNGINSGNWVYKSASASTRTTSNSSTAVTAAWHKAEIQINAAASSVSYFIDGVSLGTAIATNIPSTALTPFFYIVRSAGTVAAASVAVDLFYYNQVLTTPR